MSMKKVRRIKHSNISMKKMVKLDKKLPIKAGNPIYLHAFSIRLIPIATTFCLLQKMNIVTIRP